MSRRQHVFAELPRILTRVRQGAPLAVGPPSSGALESRLSPPPSPAPPPPHCASMLAGPRALLRRDGACCGLPDTCRSRPAVSEAANKDGRLPARRLQAVDDEAHPRLVGACAGSRDPGPGCNGPRLSRSAGSITPKPTASRPATETRPTTGQSIADIHLQPFCF